MERPAKIDKNTLPYVEHLEQRLIKFESSPDVRTYITIYDQIESFLDQLTICKKTVNVEGVDREVFTGFVDLFADKDSKEFDRIKWFFEHILELRKTLEELRKMMTPENQKELAKELAHKNLPIAEKIALNGKT